MFLPSGGSLVIDRTEAMTVIDVNTGKFTGTGGNLEATVTSNNLEAAEEIVRQLRLRDIGGIIVIDFIDMVLPSNRELLLRRLVECLGRDRTRHQVAEVTSLGLVQMTRKKIGTGLLEAFSTECPHCHGRGVRDCTTCRSRPRSRPTAVPGTIAASGGGGGGQWWPGAAAGERPASSATRAAVPNAAGAAIQADPTVRGPSRDVAAGAEAAEPSPRPPAEPSGRRLTRPESVPDAGAGPAGAAERRRSDRPAAPAWSRSSAPARRGSTRRRRSASRPTCRSGGGDRPAAGAVRAGPLRRGAGPRVDPLDPQHAWSGPWRSRRAVLRRRDDRRDLTVDELRGSVDAVIYAYGAGSDKRLDIPGEDLPGSIAAPEFVAWYCGHPDVHPDVDRRAGSRPALEAADAAGAGAVRAADRHAPPRPSWSVSATSRSTSPGC